MSTEGVSPEPSGTNPKEESSALSLIRRLQSGILSPKNLSTDDRRLCVAHLTGEGYSLAEIAEILHLSERTIARDRKAVREGNAVKQDPQLVAEVIGRVVLEADNVLSRVRRAARDKESSPANKIEAERLAWGVTRELAQILQSLGYLPSAAQQLNAKLTHQLAPGVSAEAAISELERLIRIQQVALKEDAQCASTLEATVQLLRSGSASQTTKPPDFPPTIPEDEHASQP